MAQSVGTSRLAREFYRLTQDIRKETNNQARIFSYDDEDLTEFIIEIRPKAGYYAHASFLFHFSMEFYPTRRPVVSCISSINHPNICGDSKSDNICLNIFDEWTPAFGLMTILNALLFLLNEPNFDDPNNDTFENMPPEDAPASYFYESNTRYYLWATQKKLVDEPEEQIFWEGEEDDSFAETDEEFASANVYQPHVTRQFSVCPHLDPMHHFEWYYRNGFDDLKFANLDLYSCVTQVMRVGHSSTTLQEFYFVENLPRTSCMSLYALTSVRMTQPRDAHAPLVSQQSELTHKLFVPVCDGLLASNTVFYGVNRFFDEETVTDLYGKTSKIQPDGSVVPKEYEITPQAMEREQIVFNQETHDCKHYPWSLFWRQTRWPCILLPGVVISRTLFSDYKYYAELAFSRRGTTTRLFCDIASQLKAIEDSDQETVLCLVDPLTLSPSSPLFATLIVNKEDLIVTEWITVYDSCKRCEFSLALVGLLHLLANWAEFLQRCDRRRLFGPLRLERSIARPTDSFAIGKVHLSTILSPQVNTPIFGHIGFAAEFLRLVASAIMPWNSRYSVTRLVSTVVFTDRDDF